MNENDKQITLRLSPKNGEIRDEVEGITKIDSSDIIILVHGFNVSEQEAKEAYGKFKDNFRRHFHSSSSNLNKCIYWFFWPGDGRIQLGDYNFKNPLSYAKQVPRSQECGTKFAEYLRQLQLPQGPPTRRIILVGHSLGCRLLLEALQILATSPTDVTFQVFLMAAAVPVEMVESGGRLSLAVSYVKKSSVVLYSTKDSALGWVFKIGQAWPANEPTREAVGQNGNPITAWDYRKQTYYEHNDYWKDQKTAHLIANLLKVSDDKPEFVPPPLFDRIAEFARDLFAPSRDLPERDDP